MKDHYEVIKPAGKYGTYLSFGTVEATSESDAIDIMYARKVMTMDAGWPKSCIRAHKIPQYHSAITFSGKTLSDYEASILLDHKKVDQSTLIATKYGIDLFLLGCITLTTPEGRFLYGQGVLSLVDDGIVTKEELISHLQGNDIDALKVYAILNNPWFEWQERDGETVGEVFDDIPADITELIVPE
jgi:hypothetical protein